jgi:hypothetical protein
MIPVRDKIQQPKLFELSIKHNGHLSALQEGFAAYTPKNVLLDD